MGKDRNLHLIASPDQLLSLAVEIQLAIELAPPWCKVVQTSAENAIMPKTTHVSEDKSAHRLSVSLSPEQHLELVEIANKNKVSVAWVVREAVDRLLKDDMPLLRVGKEQ